jgi:hypothetical protein
MSSEVETSLKEEEPRTTRMTQMLSIDEYELSFAVAGVDNPGFLEL